MCSQQVAHAHCIGAPASSPAPQPYTLKLRACRLACLMSLAFRDSFQVLRFSFASHQNLWLSDTTILLMCPF